MEWNVELALLVAQHMAWNWIDQNPGGRNLLMEKIQFSKLYNKCNCPERRLQTIRNNALVNWKPGTWVPGDGRDLHIKCHFKNDTPRSNFSQVPAGRGKNCV